MWLIIYYWGFSCKMIIFDIKYASCMGRIAYLCKLFSCKPQISFLLNGTWRRPEDTKYIVILQKNYLFYMLYLRELQTNLREYKYQPLQQGLWGQNGAKLGPTGPSWAPCWPHEPCYLESAEAGDSKGVNKTVWGGSFNITFCGHMM